MGVQMGVHLGVHWWWWCWGGAGVLAWDPGRGWTRDWPPASVWITRAARGRQGPGPGAVAVGLGQAVRALAASLRWAARSAAAAANRVARLQWPFTAPPASTGDGLPAPSPPLVPKAPSFSPPGHLLCLHRPVGVATPQTCPPPPRQVPLLTRPIPLPPQPPPTPPAPTLPTTHPPTPSQAATGYTANSNWPNAVPSTQFGSLIGNTTDPTNLVGVATYLVGGPTAWGLLNTNTSTLTNYFFVYPLDPDLSAGFTEGGWVGGEGVGGVGVGWGRWVAAHPPWPSPGPHLA